jgi:hypothetical protein
MFDVPNSPFPLSRFPAFLDSRPRHLFRSKKVKKKVDAPLPFCESCLAHGKKVNKQQHYK